MQRIVVVLPAPVRAEEPLNLASLNVEIDAPNGVQPAVVLDQAAAREYRRVVDFSLEPRGVVQSTRAHVRWAGTALDRDMSRPA